MKLREAVLIRGEDQDESEKQYVYMNGCVTELTSSSKERMLVFFFLQMSHLHCVIWACFIYKSNLVILGFNF